MSRLDSRLERLWYAEYPRRVIWASRYMMRRVCLDWLAMLDGQAPPPRIDLDDEAAQIVYDWEQKLLAEQSQAEAPERADPYSSLATFREALATSNLKEAAQLLGLLRHWERDQLAAGRDPDAEIIRLREQLYEFYKTDTWEGV